jgi:hypothetical protein
MSEEIKVKTSENEGGAITPKTTETKITKGTEELGKGVAAGHGDEPAEESRQKAAEGAAATREEEAEEKDK